MVWALDRLGRSAGATLRIIERLAERGVTVRVLKEGLVTNGPTGQLVITTLAAVAELERSFILERSRQGTDAARALPSTRVGLRWTVDGGVSMCWSWPLHARQCAQHAFFPWTTP